MAQGAATLKRVHFELGGKNPVIVFADADLDRALDAALFMIYSLNGERCTSSSRALVEASIYDEFRQARRRAREEDQGRPSARSRDRDRPADPSAPCREGAELYRTSAEKEGATVAAAAAAPWAARATSSSRRSISTPRNGMRIAQEEIFGPVLTVIPFADEAEALAHRQRRALRPHRLSLDPRRRPRAPLRARRWKPA